VRLISGESSVSNCLESEKSWETPNKSSALPPPEADSLI